MSKTKKRKKAENIIQRNKTDTHVMFNTHVAGQKIKQTAKEGGEIPN